MVDSTEVSLSLLLTVFAGTAVVIVALAIPLILRRVPPNGWYGLRVPATFADETVWYDANARSGWDLLFVGLLLLLLALLFPFLEVDRAAFALGWSAVATAGAIWMAIVGWRRANRLFDQRVTKAPDSRSEPV